MEINKQYRTRSKKKKLMLCSSTVISLKDVKITRTKIFLKCGLRYKVNATRFERTRSSATDVGQRAKCVQLQHIYEWRKFKKCTRQIENIQLLHMIMNHS